MIIDITGICSTIILMQDLFVRCKILLFIKKFTTSVQGISTRVETIVGC